MQWMVLVGLALTAGPGLYARQQAVDTAAIQAAIDTCVKAGGGCCQASAVTPSRRTIPSPCWPPTIVAGC